ncbi:MAG: DNA polymerase III subunit gamma/tau [Elusimicrobiota bacterium]|jgi:DNA polymerase-3 subunit gamma/tau|nr:DNA polymerase III subunit gamma/tau [Elusimicrobiota bacterium]
MSYIALARKYRPKNFCDIIGQEHISKTLMNALKSNHISHAYIFAGPRGVGKTTTARILAKTLNCLDIKLENRPCMKCEICKDEKAMDVIEIDGASNRGIDEIRDLRENVKFAPLYSKYKIYIIDEVHMLTEPAFNALLKTLEEPPLHIIFIFATTEIYKIPDTILSRCQKFNFRLISLENITNRLKFILDKENIKYEYGALDSIARASLGSMRDSLSILDQIIAYSPEIITKKETDFVLGVINSETIFETVNNILDNDTADVLKKISDILKEGYDLNQFMLQIREHYRNLMFFKVDENLTSILEILQDNFDKYKNQAKKVSLGKITRDLKMINQAIDEIKRTDYPRIVCELYLTKLSQPYLSSVELLKNLKDITEMDNFKDMQKFLNMKLNFDRQNNNIIYQENEKKLNLDEQNNSNENIFIEETENETLNKEKKLKQNEHLEENEIPKKNIFAEKQTIFYQTTEKKFNNIDIEKFLNEKWEEFLSKIGKQKMILTRYLEEIKGIEVSGNKIIFLFENKLFCEGVEKNKEIIENILQELMNKKISIAAKIKIVPNDEQYNNQNENENQTKNIPLEYNFEKKIENERNILQDKKAKTYNVEPKIKNTDVNLDAATKENESIEEEIPLPDDNELNDEKADNLKYNADDIIKFEPKIKEIIDLFGGEILPPYK